MPVVIRRGVFETNSSSVHAMAFLNNDAFEEWKNGSYVDLRSVVKSDYSRSDDEETYVDLSDKLIEAERINEIRDELPNEKYYETPDDCLLEAGIFPYEAYSETSRGPSKKWANICGGLLYFSCDPAEEDGYNIEAGWYAW